MTNVESATLETVQKHEQATSANVRLGGYHMDRVSPTSEFQLFKATLDDVDIPRLFLLGIDEFMAYTQNRTCRIADLIPETVWKVPRVYSFVGGAVDLTARQDLAVLIVAADLAAGPMVIIDGNHRAMAHYGMRRSLNGLPAFVCVHLNILQWPGFIPHLARVKQ